MLLLEKPVVIFRDGSERRKIKINEENLYNLFSKINEQDVYRYQRFWSEMHPFTEIDYYRSWLYALITVYMPEKRSTPLFEHLADINPRTMTFDYVDALLRRHRTGMYNVVGKAIADFTQVYWDDPSKFAFNHREEHRQSRSRLLDVFRYEGLQRLGLTKMSFVFELVYPLSSRVVCIDRHVGRWMGVDTSNEIIANYMAIENTWFKVCDSFKLPSPIARHILWDKHQERPNSSTSGVKVTHDIDSNVYWAYGLRKRLMKPF